MLKMEYQHLKTKGILAAKTATKVAVGHALCYLPYIGLIPKPSRKNGISVRITVKNEEEWIELNLISIKDFADEIVIVDASTDNTPEIIKKVVARYDLNLKLIHYEPDQTTGTAGEHAEHANITLKNTSFRWVLWWEGDYIAKKSIMDLKKKIISLNPNIYHAISLPAVNLEGDIFHQVQDGMLNIQSRLHTYSDALGYVTKEGFESLHIPLYYKSSYEYVIKKQYHIFHMSSLKSAKRILFRKFWIKWREFGNYNKFPTLDDYVAYRIKKDWDIDNVDEAARYHMNKIFCKSLVPYDKERFGDYPELLKEELENPGYKVIYEDGKIIGRNDTL